ncbi:SET-domain containing protein lysine methyltransferase family protein [Rhynchospora pubera]|uniref:SET-domain containing protein lysine methyltransferase family protein n=1 Tax=Rhynchospora pubera TaxID=906938 RepID=A0AAV8GJQ2_9POAL|nr:SET-domain containing protein lysine methyltransferase family protein [Rhynchospora pubera]
MRSSNNTDRAKAALNAMKDLGFGRKLAVKVLKNLLELYENKWELIEDENYSAFAEAILDAQLQDNGTRRQVGDDEMSDFGTQDQQFSEMSTQEASPLLNNCGSGVPGPSSSSRKRKPAHNSHDEMDDPVYAETDSPLLKRPRRKQPETGASSEDRAIIPMPQEPSPSSLPSPTSEGTRVVDESGKVITYMKYRRDMNSRRPSSAPLKEPKAEPDLLPESNLGDAPLAVIFPSDSDSAGNRESYSQGSQEGSERENPKTGAPSTSKAPNNMSSRINGQKISIAPCTNNCVLQEESPCSKLEIASSSNGQFKLAIYSPINLPTPSLSDFFKLVEDKCLHSYKLLPPDFSLARIMNEMCEALVERNPSDTGMSSSCLPEKATDANGGTDDNAVVVAQNPQLALGVVRPAHDSSDIARGEEKFFIPVFNDYTSDETPPNFAYIPQNLVSDNACLNLCLARIGDENCCADCYGDCLGGPVSCACARETGGEFAYTSEGLVRREFMDECLEITHDRWDPQHRAYCEGECPVERSNEAMGKCKGHLRRKFIKECWSKCGCNKGCGNRVVQRGITCQLQVFMTGNGKGWGLRTVDEIPKGTFVCEYAGEILTAKEYQERYNQRKASLMNSQPVLLDADWAARSGLKNEEALCLDATFYGNIARFINHRCYDANLVEIPIEIETPDRLYYHLALFTSRKIEPLEELTWDYGIDFKQTELQNRSFKCLCGSKYCRDTKRSRKGKGKQ